MFNNIAKQPEKFFKIWLFLRLSSLDDRQVRIFSDLRTVRCFVVQRTSELTGSAKQPVLLTVVVVVAGFFFRDEANDCVGSWVWQPGWFPSLEINHSSKWKITGHKCPFKSFGSSCTQKSYTVETSIRQGGTRPSGIRGWEQAARMNSTAVQRVLCTSLLPLDSTSLFSCFRSLLALYRLWF